MKMSRMTRGLFHWGEKSMLKTRMQLVHNHKSSSLGVELCESASISFLNSQTGTIPTFQYRCEGKMRHLMLF